MRDFLLVLKFELQTMVRKKSFLISTVLVAAAAFVLLSIPRVFSNDKGTDDTASEKDKTMLIYDGSGILKNRELAEKNFPEFQISYANSLSEVEEKVKKSEADAGFEVKTPTSFQYYVNNSSLNDANSSRFKTLLQQQYQASELAKLKYDAGKVQAIYQTEVISDTTVLGTDGMNNYFYTYVLILVLSKDLGGALILFVSYVLMLFIATGNWLYLTGGLGLGCGAAVAAYHLFDHVKRRVAAWKNPWADIDNTGYQITQSLFAIGTGGWFGMGLCQGMPGKIPVVEKDFIFAAISEEFGGIFAICLLLICLGCFIQFMMIASRMQAMFYKLIAFGLGIQYVTQVFLTVGGVTKFIPSTGVTLPFVSYGGSSIVSTFMLFAMIQGLYIIKRNDEEEMEEAEQR